MYYLTAMHCAWTVRQATRNAKSLNGKFRNGTHNINFGCPPPFTHVQSPLVDVGENDGAGAHGERGQEVDEADGAGAAHEDVAAQGDAAASARVDADGERLHEGALLQAHVLRQLQDERFNMDWRIVMAAC